MARVTESLRRQWEWQVVQGLEERTHDQAGRRRDPQSLALHDLDIAVARALLELPVGATFDAREVSARVQAELYPNGLPA